MFVENSMNKNNDKVEIPNKKLFPISASSKSAIVIFITVILIIAGMTFLMWAIRLMDTYIARLCLTMIVIVAYTMVAIIAMIVTGQFNQLLPNKEKLGLQILIGVSIAAALCLVFGIIPILCGTSLIGSHSDIPMDRMVLIAIQDILFVGVGEEIVFRGYIQNQLTIWLKSKWLAPLFAAVLFGLWHLINGSIIQVLFTTMIGCIFGYSKYCIKHCSLLSVIIAHGLYDFSLVLLTCFML